MTRQNMNRRGFFVQLTAYTGLTAALGVVATGVPLASDALWPRVPPAPPLRLPRGPRTSWDDTEYRKQLRYQHSKWIGEMRREMADQFFGFGRISAVDHERSTITVDWS